MFIAAYWKIILAITAIGAAIIVTFIYFSRKKEVVIGASIDSTQNSHANAIDASPNDTQICYRSKYLKPVEQHKQCILKTVAMRVGCIHLMSDKYNCSQKEGYSNCALKKKEHHFNDQYDTQICYRSKYLKPVEQHKQCFLKTVAMRVGCVHLMSDKYSCSQKGGYSNCALKKKEHHFNDQCHNIHGIIQPRPSNLECKRSKHATGRYTYRPVIVRTYVKKNGTVVYSHGRSRKSR